MNIDFQNLLSEGSDDADKPVLTRALVIVLFFAATMIVLLLFIDLILLIAGTDKGGVFGDFLGGVLNPILTFCTLFGLLITIVIQRQELKLARVEHEKTAIALGTQAVETTFFNILDLHHKIVDNLRVDLNELKSDDGNLKKKISNFHQINGNTGIIRKEIFSGRSVFDVILTIISSHSLGASDTLDEYKNIQDNHNHLLGHYFRNLYKALKVIDGYSDSILSKSEKFKNLLIKYSILEHLPIEKDPHDDFYSFYGMTGAFINQNMIDEYLEETEINESDTFPNGAFGSNIGVKVYNEL